jgi:serine/threonine protein kinase
MSPSAEAGPSGTTSPLSFEHVANLAVGGTANVELCRVTSAAHHGALVAVKRLRPGAAEDPEFVSMFRDEMWMASALRHPNIAQVLGWGEDEEGLYLAVEFVHGVSLERLMKTVFATGEAFNERLVVHLAACVCEGLRAAHEARAPSGEYLSLVHRDLTPGNILLSFEGDVKITDFGLAKAKQRVTETAIGMTKGEPAYMSPEQVCGRGLDGRSDLFALGVVLFEMFAQRRPWVVKGVKDALESIVEGRHPDLLELQPRLDKSLVSVVDRCLAKDPNERFDSASALKNHLDEWLHLNGWDDNKKSLGRFVRRNALKQMRWLERAIAGTLSQSEEVASPFQRTRADSRTPSSSFSGSVAGSGDLTRSTASGRNVTSKRSAVSGVVVPPAGVSDDSMITAMQRPRASETSTRARDAAPPLGAAGDHAIPLPSAPPAQTRVDYRGAAASVSGISDPPTVQEGRAHGHAARPDPVPPARVYPPAVPPVDEPSTPMPLIRPSQTKSEEVSTLQHANLGEQLQRSAHRMYQTANDLARRAAAAADEAERAAEKARAAANASATFAHRVELAAEAVKLTAEAMDRAKHGDEQAAAEQLQHAEQLHKRAARD